jgi:hypothetical protein
MSELAASGERLVVRFKKLGCCVKNQDCQIEDREKSRKEGTASKLGQSESFNCTIQFRLRIIIAEKIAGFFSSNSERRI